MPWTDDRGAGSVLVVALVGVLAGLAMVVVGLAQASHARHGAQTAADLAALAAATALHGSLGAEPCAVARDVTQANEAQMSRCDIQGETVVVGAEVPMPGLLGSGGGLAGRAEARAGPVDDPEQ